MTEVERAELDGEEEVDEVRWVVCEPVWVVLADGGDSGGAGAPVRHELVPGVNAVAVWRAEREAARRLTVVKRQPPRC